MYVCTQSTAYNGCERLGSASFTSKHSICLAVIIVKRLKDQLHQVQKTMLLGLAF